MDTVIAIDGMERTSPAFRRETIAMSRRLGLNPDYVFSVFKFEANLDPAARNKQSGAVGLIQFTKGTAEKLGVTREWLQSLDAVDQLPWVEKYFRAVGGTNLSTLSDTYLAVFAPARMRLGPGATVYAAPSLAYQQNKALDRNGDGKITVAEATAPVTAIYARGIGRTRLAVGGDGGGRLLAFGVTAAAAGAGVYLERKRVRRNPDGALAAGLALATILGLGVAAAVAKPKKPPFVPFDIRILKKKRIPTDELRRMAKRAIFKRDTPAGKVAFVHRLIAEGDAAGPLEVVAHGEPVKRNRYRRATFHALSMGAHVSESVLGYSTDKGLSEAGEVLALYIIEQQRMLETYFPNEVESRLRAQLVNLNQRYVKASLPGAQKLGAKYQKRIIAADKLPAPKRRAAYRRLLAQMLSQRFLMLDVPDPEKMQEELVAKIEDTVSEFGVS